MSNLGFGIPGSVQQLKYAVVIGGSLPQTYRIRSSVRSSVSFAGILFVYLVCLAFQPQPVQSYSEYTRVRRLGGSYLKLFPIASGDSGSEWKFVRGRSLLATNTSTEKFRPLAPRDDRLNPFDSFNHYRAGYDIKSKNYWGSVVFTGIYGYAIAAAWLVLGLVVLLVLCCRCLCRRSSKASKRPRTIAYHCVPWTIIFLLSAATVGSSVVLFIACKNFTSQAYNVEDVIVDAAQNATNAVYTVSDTLNEVKGNVLPYNRQLYRTLNSTESQLVSIADLVNEKVFVNKKTYQKVFKIVEIVLLVVTSLSLLLIILGLVSTFLRWRRFFYFIIVVTWMFTALTWVMFGFFLTVHNIADDTCLAFKQYLENPQNTTLDDLLPCSDLASSDTQYTEIREALKNVISDATDQFLFYANGSTDLTGVCDPIGPPPEYKYTGICANDTLPISELSNLVKPFVCNGTRKECLKIYPFYANQTTYNGIAAMTKASQSILDAFPLMEGLTNCSLLLNPIKTMVNVRCGPAKVAINRIWDAFAVLSSILVLLIIFWCLVNRRYNEQRQLTSIVPHQSPPRPPYKLRH